MALMCIWQMAREEIYVMNIECVKLYLEHCIKESQCQGNKSMNMYEMENFFDDSNIAYSEIACESMQ